VVRYLSKPVTREKLAETIGVAVQSVRRILVADDDPDTRWLLDRMLSAGGNVEVVVVADGEEALRQMKIAPPDLVLLDIIMPGTDGWEVLRRKAADPALRSIPVILISGQDALAPPASSAGMLVTMGDGLSMAALLRLSLECSALLLSTGRTGS
jgi:CheY-like chemotaxis protein